MDISVVVVVDVVVGWRKEGRIVHESSSVYGFRARSGWAYWL